MIRFLYTNSKASPVVKKHHMLSLAARPNPSIERTCPGKPGHASHVKR